MQIFRRSRRYLDSIAGDTSRFHVVRIIRDPYARAASIFREAFVGDYADRDAALVGFNFSAGMSFHMFLLMVERLDMETVDTHYRPQFHPFERQRRPDTIINISKSDLFSVLNAFERRMAWPVTNFAAMHWFHELEQSRRAPPPAFFGLQMYKAVIVRGNPPSQTPFPHYKSLLPPEAKRRIESIYREDFGAYRALL